MSRFFMAHVLQNLAAAALGTGPPRPAMETQVSFLRRCLAGLQRNPERSGREPNIICPDHCSLLFISTTVSWLQFV